MAHIFKKNSYEDILNEFNEAIKWLKSCEASIEPTRINKYRKTLNLFIDAYKEGTTKKILDGGEFPKIVGSFYEIREIIDIWSGLKDISDEELRKRLREFVKGPENIAHELSRTSSNYPRNIGFELHVASRFAISGFNVKFSSGGDISVLYKKNPLYIECKRPNQLNKLKKNINKAFEQLERRYGTNNDEARGLIALSVNKLINPEQKLLVMNTLDDLSGYLGKLVEQFIKYYEHHWQGKNEKRTIGTLISLQVPCIIKDQNLLTIGREMGVNNTTIPGTKVHNHLIDIAKKLDEGTNFL